MVLDHAGLALVPSLGALRCAGRVAFPLYCFLLVQGFVHTRDVRAYGRRLLLLAILSEIPFDLLIFGLLVSPMEQNVLFSLLLSLMALWACHSFEACPLQAWLVCATLAVSSMALRLSYGWLGVALCLCFYLLRENRLRMALSATGALLLYSLSLFLSGVDIGWVLTSLCAPLSLLPILLYNDKPGPRRPWLSYLFYAAYPAHLLLLALLRAMRLIPPYFLQ